MDAQIFQLRYTAKQMSRQAKKSEKAEKAEKLKLKKAIEKGNMDGARIYAQNAIREKNMAQNYLRLSSRVDAVVARLDTAMRMRQVTTSLGGVVKGMDKAMESMNLDQISAVMDRFEKQFEDMDVAAEYVEGAINEQTAMSTPHEEVDTLIQQVADEHGLELSIALGTEGVAPSGIAAEKEGKGKEEAPKDDLMARLDLLRG